MDLSRGSLEGTRESGVFGEKMVIRRGGDFQGNFRTSSSERTVDCYF